MLRILKIVDMVIPLEPDVPEIKDAAAGVFANSAVAAKPVGALLAALIDVDSASSSKSKRFSACCPATIFCNAFLAERSPSALKMER